MGTAAVNVTMLAQAYRRLVLWFGVQLAVGIVGPVGVAIAGDSLVGAAVAVGYFGGILATMWALVYYAFLTARALGSRVAVVWALAMLVPLANAITLLILSSRATKACRAHGVPVGLLGPKLSKRATDAEPGTVTG
jgi:hypothetical protein